MTHYLLFSETTWNARAEKAQAEWREAMEWYEDGHLPYFPDWADRIYLDSSGEPVQTTEVAKKMPAADPESDLRCVDTVKKLVCLVNAKGFTADGKAFCAKKNIEETLIAIRNYMEEAGQRRTLEGGTQRDIQVSRPLQLKRAPPAL